MDGFTFPHVLDTPADHPLRRGPGRTLSRLFARLRELRNYARREYRHDAAMLAILLELEEIEELLQRLTQPHAALTLDIRNDVITTQPEPGSVPEVAATPSRSSRHLTLTRTSPNGNNRAQVNRGSHADDWTR